MSLAGVLCSAHRRTATLVYRINPISHGYARPVPREQRASFHSSFRSGPSPIFYSTGKTAATPGAAATVCHRGAVMIGYPPRARVSFDLFFVNGTNVSPRRRAPAQEAAKTYRNDEGARERERLRVQVHQGIFRLYSGEEV